MGWHAVAERGAGRRLTRLLVVLGLCAGCGRGAGCGGAHEGAVDGADSRALAGDGGAAADPGGTSTVRGGPGDAGVAAAVVSCAALVARTCALVGEEAEPCRVLRAQRDGLSEAVCAEAGGALVAALGAVGAGEGPDAGGGGDACAALARYGCGVLGPGEDCETLRRALQTMNFDSCRETLTWLREAGSGALR